MTASPQILDKQISRPSVLLVWLSTLAIGAVTLGILIGSSGFDNPLSFLSNPVSLGIIYDIRLPRSIGAWFAGALLGLSGALAQGLFRNSLADPYLLGSASGASLGVASVLVLVGTDSGNSSWKFRLGLSGGAFLGAILAVTLTLILSKGVQHTLRLLLAGIVVAVIVGAVTSLFTIINPQITLPMQSFLMGSTNFMNWDSVFLLGSAWFICSVLAWSLSKALDALSLGELTAISLGLRLRSVRFTLIAALALAIGTSVAQTGLIAFVGLAAPHLIRSLVKVTHNWLILLSSMMGGLLLLTADLGARWLIAPEELPVGVLTAVIGGVYLLCLLYTQNVNSETL